MNGSGEIGVLRRADLLDRIPELAPVFGLARLKKTEIGLIVGVNAGHNFDVGRVLAVGVGVSQIAVPGVTEIMVAPGPLLLSRRDMMVGDVDDAGLRPIIVAAKKILLA